MRNGWGRSIWAAAETVCLSEHDADRSSVDDEHLSGIAAARCAPPSIVFSKVERYATHQRICDEFNLGSWALIWNSHNPAFGTLNCTACCLCTKSVVVAQSSLGVS